MGRSSHGKSESFRPGSGKPLVGRRFSYDQVPEWDGLFGEQVQGEYGPRMREDKEFKPRINESILKIRESVREQVRNIKETSYQITDRTRQDYLDNAWDRQIETDAKSGRLDALIQRAELDIAANRIKPLDEVLHHF